MTKRKTENTPSEQQTGGMQWIWIVLSVLVMIGAVALLIFLSRDRSAPATEATATTTPGAVALLRGHADHCRYASDLDVDLSVDFSVETQAPIGTSLEGSMGLALSDMTGNVYYSPASNERPPG